MTQSRYGVAVISGGGSGIGAAAARALARRGHPLALLGRRAAPLERVLGAVPTPGRSWTVDVRDSEAIGACCESISRQLGEVEVVVAAAGVASVKPFVEIEPAEFERTLTTNLGGAANLFRAFLPGMIERGRGTLVPILSVAARRVFSGWSAYSASKWGLLGLVETLREELQGTGVRVLALTPGATATPLWDDLAGDWDRSRMIAADEVGEALVWALDRGERSVIEEIRLQPPGGNL